VQSAEDDSVTKNKVLIKCYSMEMSWEKCVAQLCTHKTCSSMCAL
jgi:hypothetical protein